MWFLSNFLSFYPAFQKILLSWFKVSQFRMNLLPCHKNVNNFSTHMHFVKCQLFLSLFLYDKSLKIKIKCFLHFVAFAWLTDSNYESFAYIKDVNLNNWPECHCSTCLAMLTELSECPHCENLPYRPLPGLHLSSLPYHHNILHHENLRGRAHSDDGLCYLCTCTKIHSCMNTVYCLTTLYVKNMILTHNPETTDNLNYLVQSQDSLECCRYCSIMGYHWVLSDC